MRRDGKYKSNKTIRYCKYCSGEIVHSDSSNNMSLDKKKRWQLIELLKKYSQSSNDINKIVTRRCYNFHMYNGYSWHPKYKRSPLKHLSFAKRPDFVYQPYVKFVKVNQNIFNLIFQDGLQVYRNEKKLLELFDIDSTDITVTFIYFMDGPKHWFPNDWNNAYKHAFGGSLADFYMGCTGDYCSFGPKVHGLKKIDSRIDQILFVSTSNERQGRMRCCQRVAWKYLSCFKGDVYKEERRRKKSQRREGNRLTKNTISTKNFF
ncbi:unnamed protein product [Adineta steineri]|uniref:Uncharacterized protein n=1 Tax=Adineta steineri TaxID=433720 RepID=A0A819ETQ2_9BILA|nr:unnamed protein product [Adineta steineri]CAF3856477.1 unnamed protein product [Adineta steineri]